MDWPAACWEGLGAERESHARTRRMRDTSGLGSSMVMVEKAKERAKCRRVRERASERVIIYDIYNEGGKKAPSKSAGSECE